MKIIGRIGIGILVCAMVLTGTLAYAWQMVPNPVSAAEDILEAISTWEQGDAIDFLSDVDDAGAYLVTFGGVAEQLAARMSYQVHTGRVTGRTAVVDVTVSAVNVGDIANPLLTQSATYLAFSRIMNRPADLNVFIADRSQVLVENALTISIHTSMHLILGTDGQWRLDLSNEDNLMFLNALCGGGILPHITAIESIIERAATIG